MRIYKVGPEYFTDPDIADDYRRRLSLSPRKLKVIETVEERLPAEIVFRVYGIYDKTSGCISYSVAANEVDPSYVEHISTIEVYCMTSSSIWFYLTLKSRNRKELDKTINDQGFKVYMGKVLKGLSRKSLNANGKIIEKI